MSSSFTPPYCRCFQMSSGKTAVTKSGASSTISCVSLHQPDEPGCSKLDTNPDQRSAVRNNFTSSEASCFESREPLQTFLPFRTEGTRNHTQGVDAVRALPVNLPDAAAYCRQDLSKTFFFVLVRSGTLNVQKMPNHTKLDAVK